MNSRKRTAIAIALAAVGVVVAGLVGAVAVAYSGAVDVAATEHPSGLTRWFLSTTRDHSVAARAKDVTAPPLDGAAMLAMGADHYREMCVTCHGAPGIESGEAAQGLEPSPPKLPTDRKPAETFWIVKNGIQMTGMPAFGKTHDDKKIWAIVAFVKRLRGMSPAEYRKFAGVERDGEHPEHEDHDHADHDER